MLYGTLEKTEDGRSQLRFTRMLTHSQETVWRAITEPEHLAHWFPSTIDGERAAGAEITFQFPDGAGVDRVHGRMLAYEPMSVMEFEWGTDIIRLELRAVAGGTELTLLDILDQHGKAARDGAGWHACLDSLESHLSGQENARENMDLWRQVHPHYVEAFGPEAATIGPPEGMA